MKTKIVIELNTKDMADVYELDDAGKEINIKDQLEQALHDLLRMGFTEESIKETFEDEVLSNEFFEVDDDEFTKLKDYGNIKLTVNLEGD